MKTVSTKRTIFSAITIYACAIFLCTCQTAEKRVVTPEQKVAVNCSVHKKGSFPAKILVKRENRYFVVEVKSTRGEVSAGEVMGRLKNQNLPEGPVNCVNDYINESADNE